ncbi:glycerate kinase [Arcicella sp. DC2W]|uniref:Glycerate kinase n=1 Tax=Arcicella gelida TaxID=2984195 RepID=A0ABU5S5P2_9BACT|nr:glycerate kinase [Arcicella sp. DC2W]MEA5403775.1 glycerate kinase [Arcicella sp. DC2W]
MRILIATNAFKHSLNANDVSKAIKNGFERSQLNCICESFPIGDGGDGTGELIIKHCGGIEVSGEVVDPLMRKIQANYGLIDNRKTAVIEMASASGIRLLKKEELNPLEASTFGTGLLIKSALNQGVNKIILAVGGSATVDGGCGILAALGVTFLNEKGDKIGFLPKDLINLVNIDITNLDARIFDCEIVILSDVKNPLLGENSSAKVFGPQKGATVEDVEFLEKVLVNFAEVIHRQFGKSTGNLEYGGAAGGVSAGLASLLNAKLVNGIDAFLSLTGFDEALKRNDIVITGEGSLDSQTMQGKGPFGIAERAKALNIPVIGLAGRVPLEDAEALKSHFEVVFVIGNEPTELKNAIENTAENLTRTAEQIANLLAISYKR